MSRLIKWAGWLTLASAIVWLVLALTSCRPRESAPAGHGVSNPTLAPAERLSLELYTAQEVKVNRMLVQFTVGLAVGLVLGCILRWLAPERKEQS